MMIHSDVSRKFLKNNRFTICYFDINYIEQKSPNFTTDNAKNMRRACKLPEQKYPYFFSLGV